MDFKTLDYWDQELWNKCKTVYSQAFTENGAKSEKIIRNMFRKHICYLHIVEEDHTVVGMALTGKLKGSSALLIDYLAVGKEVRGQGIGHRLVEYLKKWSRTEGNFDSFLIEVEAEPTPVNIARTDFWSGCGFILTDYVHHYIWAPEPYQAMFQKLKPTATLPERGEDLFKLIGNFHKASYHGA